MLAAGVPVGLGVDGTASNESGELHTELRNALLINRLGAHREAALNARQALRLGTYGGAQVLGRADEIGSLKPGKLADLVLWKLDTLGPRLDRRPGDRAGLRRGGPGHPSFVNGKQIVENSRLLHVDEDAIARTTRAEARRLAGIAGATPEDTPAGRTPMPSRPVGGRRAAPSGRERRFACAVAGRHRSQPEQTAAAARHARGSTPSGSATSLRAVRSISPPTAVISAATVPSALRIVCWIRNVLPSPHTKSHVTSTSSPASSSRR